MVKKIQFETVKFAISCTNAMLVTIDGEFNSMGLLDHLDSS
jgi:hypothetical protein